MESWKNHVRAQLLRRDQTEKYPYEGVFTTLSRLAERLEIRKLILDDVQSKSLEQAGVEVGTDTRLLHLQLRESEHLAEKLSQTVSDLTAVLYLKEAELQYWQSQVSRFRREALALAKGSNTLKGTLSECEFTIESQSKELAALRTEQRELRDALAEAWRENEQLLRRWMEEKRMEADRLNKYNDAQERWQRLAWQLKKHLHREMKKHCAPIVTHSWSGATEASPPSAVQIHDGNFSVQTPDVALAEIGRSVSDSTRLNCLIDECLFVVVQDFDQINKEILTERKRARNNPPTTVSRLWRRSNISVSVFSVPHSAEKQNRLKPEKSPKGNSLQLECCLSITTNGFLLYLEPLATVSDVI